MKITRAVVPSLFTVLNMFCGFLSIISAAESNFGAAAGFIILGAIFDSLDGVMARITKSSSAFGVEFDSLSDVVTFGAAPSFLVHELYLHTLGGIGMVISAIPMIMGGIRLARFNVQLVGFDKDYFTGLPIPMQAIALSAFVLNFTDDDGRLTAWLADALAPLVVVLGILMVSKVKYDTLPKPSWRFIKKRPAGFIVLAVALLALAVTGGKALFPLILLYILSGLIRAVVKLVRHEKPAAEEEDDPEISSVDV